jgi:soluble lytic murein transglycosylase
MASLAVSRIGRYLLTFIVSGTLAGVVAAQSSDGGALQAQRAAFKQAYASASQGGDAWRALAANLRDYPLYPYLQAASLEHDLQQIDRPTVEAYLRQYPDLIPANDLRRDFLQELARRQDWTDFVAMYQPGLGDALSCGALQAQLAGGAKLDFDRDLAALWSQPALPAACDPVLQAAYDQGLLPPVRIWARIDAAVDAGKTGTITGLAKWLPPDDAQTAQNLALALNDPAAAVTAARQWPDTPRTRQAAALALVRLARRQSDTADKGWQTLKDRFHFSPEQRDQVLNALAVFHATDFDSQALARLIDLPATAQTPASREWRVRVALAAKNWQGVLDAIAAMPATQQQDDEWQYFRARALSELGRADEASHVYADVADQSSYFGYLAADHRGVPYALCSTQLSADPQARQAVLAIPGMRRAFELYAVGMFKPARREWNQALANADAHTIQQAVILADERGWYDRAVFAFNKGDALSYYALRFPLASQDGLVPQAQQAGIDPSWAYGILRVESAWMSDAHTSADARGLMQLVPGTAADVARRNGLAWAGGNSLYDPATNVELGTRYLAQMVDRFSGSLWLASAAYNAGAARVGQWTDARGALPPDLFVATIPFKETREYVARVMYYSVIYDWRMHGTAAPISSRMAPIDQPYGRSNSMDARKDLTCPASMVAATSPAAMPAPAPAASSKPGIGDRTKAH